MEAKVEEPERAADSEPLLYSRSQNDEKVVVTPTRAEARPQEDDSRAWTLQPEPANFSDNMTIGRWLNIWARQEHDTPYCNKDIVVAERA